MPAIGGYHFRTAKDNTSDVKNCSDTEALLAWKCITAVYYWTPASPYHFTKCHDRRFNEIRKYSTAVVFTCVKFVISADGNTAVTRNLFSVFNCRQFL